MAQTVRGRLLQRLRTHRTLAPVRQLFGRIEYVRRRMPHDDARKIAAFAPEQRPAAAPGPPRPAAQRAPDIERVVKQLQETLTVRLERTIHEHVQKRLANRSRFARGLADQIQSELYHDIVFERERLGLRGMP